MYKPHYSVIVNILVKSMAGTTYHQPTPFSLFPYNRIPVLFGMAICLAQILVFPDHFAGRGGLAEQFWPGDINKCQPEISGRSFFFLDLSSFISLLFILLPSSWQEA